MSRFTLPCFAFALVLTLLAPAASAQPGLPDLQITSFSITSPTTITCSQQVATIRIVETNTGSRASGPFSVSLVLEYIGGASLPAIARPSLAGQSSRRATLIISWFNGPCDCVPGSYVASFHMDIDSTSSVAESNENNNSSATVILPGTCP